MSDLSEYTFGKETFTTKAIAFTEKGANAAPMEIPRRVPTDTDVHIAIKYAGICHSDIHCVNGDWESAGAKSIYPMVPGHEIVGEVKAVGSAVTKFKVGDIVGVGCMVDSCRECSNCKKEKQNHCRKGMVLTYSSRESHPHCPGYAEGDKAAPTFGGYSNDIVVTESFVLKVPANLDLAATAPLLCAGITTYAPLADIGLKKGQRLGVAGLGGLGHMAVKFGVAMGAEVTVLSRGTAKKSEATERLGAHHYLDMKDDKAVAEAATSLDVILDTISAEHDLSKYLGLLDYGGTLIVVGAPPEPHKVNAFALLMHNLSIKGSIIGGIEQTQEMLDFCGKHNIVSDIEMIEAKDVDAAYKRVMSSDVRYRFVIDTKTIQ